MEKIKKIIYRFFKLQKSAKRLTLWAIMLEGLAAGFALVYTNQLNNLYELITKMSDIRKLGLCFSVVGVILIIQEILNGLSNYVIDKQSVSIKKNYISSLIDIVDNLSCEQCMQSKILDKLNIIENSTDQCIDVLIHIEVILSYFLIYIIFMLGYLSWIHPAIMLCMLLTTIPAIISYKYRLINQVELQQEIAVLRRKKSAYIDYISDIRYLKETRFWKKDTFFKDKFINVDKLLIKKRNKKFDEKNRIDMLINLSYIPGLVALVIVLTVLFRYELIEIWQVATVFSIVMSIYSSLNELMNFHIAGIAENINSFIVMNDLELELINQEVKTTNTSSDTSHIELKNVSFIYPGQTQSALKNISLNVENGKLIAIVGENGSGKSTLSKIIAGLYSPTEGKIFYNDEEIKSNTSYYDDGSFVLQNYAKYPLTIKENVCLQTEDKVNEEDYINSIKFSEIDEIINKENDKDDTVLAKDMGGTDWSGGQWQRLAIARGIYKNSKFVIYDEPTAAIDPIEENFLLNKIVDSCKNKTSILVTHRIGIAKKADLIIVMDNGEIVEKGTHDELMKLNRKYATMYNNQKQWYC